jgi:predicted acylesterase/phospholipase RssA
MLKLAKFFLLLLATGTSVLAQDPCAEFHRRALVMGGGGSKGAFEAGAAYHLIVHRGCDFREVSGNSVGALNGAILAQAKRSADPDASLENLRTRAEALIGMWTSIRSSKDIVRNRPLAALRLGLFGTESLKNFSPLRNLITRNVDLERLDDGRELRVGLVSFRDGRYHEIVLNGAGETDSRAHEMLFASSMIPTFGTMPRVSNTSATQTAQYCDGNVRHSSPVQSYFVSCPEQEIVSGQVCRQRGRSGVPAHPAVEQLFVIVTTPYQRNEVSLPVANASMFKRGTPYITDGRKIMSRALDLMMDTVHHSDLDGFLMSNDMLKWHSHAAEARDGFPLESFNYDPLQPENASMPYGVGIVAPSIPDNGIDEILDFSPKRISQQLYCGCVAADRMMQLQFGSPAMADRCSERFPITAASRTSCGPVSLVTASM